MLNRPEESAQAKKTNEKVKKMLQVRALVKQLVATYPDYQIRTWCRASDKELAGDIILDWINHKETLPPPDKELVIENWAEVLSVTTHEVATLVKNYGK